MKIKNRSDGNLNGGVGQDIFRHKKTTTLGLWFLYYLIGFYNPNCLANRSGNTPRTMMEAITTTATML